MITGLGVIPTGVRRAGRDATNAVGWFTGERRGIGPPIPSSGSDSGSVAGLSHAFVYTPATYAAMIRDTV